MVRLFYAFLALLILGSHVPAALAADASVTISSPQNGAKFSPRTEVDVVYEATLGSNGNHVHLYVDGDEPVVLHAMKGSHSVGKLTVGLHKICINVVNKAHAPVGAQACVNVTVE
ncbi:MAG TPA: hypothetical protein VFI43_04100 [Nitrosospira sp.]|nr:hypothetical protein [Nitrosospira sp.]